MGDDMDVIPEREMKVSGGERVWLGAGVGREGSVA